ncbi:SWIM zinc finger family protein [Gordonia malaquae]|uniref:SWIM zinc finger family protein n=1 Tax=Gordonia malaquae TaxID=410332 RepID=UPI0030C7A072
MPWTQEQVIAAAPDAASVAAGRKLASPGPWSGTGATDALLWGSCQGSGKKPYQVSIDLTGPAFRCSCPSRKFPCKHAIALLLLWSAGAIADGEVSDFASSWADERASKAKTRSKPAAPVDPQAQAARRAERVAKMDAGVREFSRWLSDLVRAGLAEALRRPLPWWETTASRLVDAQAPGLAERVRDTGADVVAGLGADELLERIGVWWMLVQAWSRRDSLTTSESADLHAALGWPTPTAEVRGGAVESRVWTVVGAHRDQKGRLAQQRTWLRDDDGRYRLLLETAGPGQSLGVPALAGARLRADLAIYPGAEPCRGLFVDTPEALEPHTRFGAGQTVDAALADAATAFATTPWRDRHPVMLADVRFGARHVVDPSGQSLELVEDTPSTELAAISGGRADHVFGELDGGRFRVLTVSVDGRVVPL